MPFGLEGGELVVALLAAFLVYAVPLVAVVWAVVTVMRLRRGLAELETRLATIERQVGGRK